jgi:hypothetical protein
MKNGIFLNLSLVLLLFLFPLSSTDDQQYSRCLYMLSESEMLNFHDLKSGYEENK